MNKSMVSVEILSSVLPSLRNGRPEKVGKKKDPLILSRSHKFVLVLSKPIVCKEMVYPMQKTFLYGFTDLVYHNPCFLYCKKTRKRKEKNPELNLSCY